MGQCSRHAHAVRNTKILKTKPSPNWVFHAALLFAEECHLRV